MRRVPRAASRDAAPVWAARLARRACDRRLAELLKLRNAKKTCHITSDNNKLLCVRNMHFFTLLQVNL